MGTFIFRIVFYAVAVYIGKKYLSYDYFEKFLGAATIWLVVMLIIDIARASNSESRDIKNAKKKTLKNLKFMEKYSNEFDWMLTLQKIKNIYVGIIKARASGDFYEISEWMTKLFWKSNQALSYNWLNNIKIKGLPEVTPIFFKHTNYKLKHEGSMLVTIIGIKVFSNNKNYIMKQIWSFSLEDGTWKVSSVEDFAQLKDYLQASKKLADIKSTFFDK